MDPAPGLADRRGEHVHEGGHVVLGDELALVHLRDREGGAADRLQLRRRSGRRLRAGPGSSSQAASSTSRQASMRASSVHSAPSSGRV